MDVKSVATETTELSALVKGRRFHFQVSLAEQRTLVYHLDCLSGVALCAEPIFREFWTPQALGSEGHAALAA